MTNEILITEYFCPHKKEWFSDSMYAKLFDKIVPFGFCKVHGNLFTVEKKKDNGSYFTLLVKIVNLNDSKKEIQLSEVQL